MQQIKDFLKGKKTYIGAAALALVSIFGWWFGALNGTIASGMLAASFGIAGLAAKGDRLAAATMEALNEAKRVQQLRASGQKIDWNDETKRITQIVLDQVKDYLPPTLSWSGTTSPVPVYPSNAAVTFPQVATLSCLFCALPIDANGGICTSKANNSAPDAAGNRHHCYLVPAPPGVSAK